MEEVDAAEKEASEVLHSLLSVERIEKQTIGSDNCSPQVVVLASAEAQPSFNSLQTDTVTTESEDQTAFQWHTPVTVQHALFTTPTLSGDQVIWQISQESLTPEQQDNIFVPSVADAPVSEPESFIQTEPLNDDDVVVKENKRKSNKVASDKAPPAKRERPAAVSSLDPSATISGRRSDHAETCQLESSAQEVRERFEKGCECQEENCFKGLNPENVYRHRLNIAELTKGEHDMYLMGVTMAVLTNPEETVRHKERRRLRAQYVFQGRRVCLDAFLYLENCTNYQLKRIRKHVMTHGVAPRVHGNHGKKPHNTFPLDSYRHAAGFLRQFIEEHTPGPNHSQLNNSSNKAKNKSPNKTLPLYLPSEITRKTIHNAYRKYCENFDPSIKVMGYSTFRQYMKEQFPYVKFCKQEGSASKNSSSNQQQQHQQQQPQPQQPQIQQQLQQQQQQLQQQQQQHPQLQQQQQQQLLQQQQQEQQQMQQLHQQDDHLQDPSTMGVEILSQGIKLLQSDIDPSEEHCEAQSATIINAAGNVQQVTAIPIVLSQASPHHKPIMTQQQQQLQTHQQQQTTFIVTPVSQLLQTSGHTINSNNGGTFTSYHLTSPNQVSYTSQEQLNQNHVGTITVASLQSNGQPGSYAFTAL